MDAGHGGLPFRSIAIVEDAASALRVLAACGDHRSTMAIMLRDPQHRPERVEAVARELAGQVPHEVTIIANDLAIASLTRWVHLPYAHRERAAGLTEQGFDVGVSVHSREEAITASKHVRYLIASPVFPTSSKPGNPGIGIEELRVICAAVDVPVIALGGISAATIAQCIEAGAWGVAGISMFADDASVVTVLERAGRHGHPPVAITIAGSDSGGGAGIQADLKTMEAFGVFGTTAITSITAQNTTGVRAVYDLPLEIVRAQLEAIFDDFDIAAIKIGMLSSRTIIDAVADVLTARSAGAPIVLDPVMVATSGDRLLRADAVGALIERLLPRATVVTPNADEAAILAAIPVTDVESMSRAARAIVAMGARAVFLKGGHIAPRTGPGGDRMLVDILVDDSGELLLETPHIDTTSTHGTGCTISSAIAARLAHGDALIDAVRAAQSYVHGAIANAPGIGHGHGPLAHAWRRRSG